MQQPLLIERSKTWWQNDSQQMFDSKINVKDWSNEEECEGLKLLNSIYRQRLVHGMDMKSIHYRFMFQDSFNIRKTALEEKGKKKTSL